MPLIKRKQAFGALNVYASDMDAFGDTEVEQLRTLADNLAFGILSLRSHADRHQLNRQLQQSQKMDALGELTGGVAHDFNNMLGVVQGYAELLALSLADQPKLAEYVSEIYKASKRSARLTQKLLAFSRQKNFLAEAVNINHLLQANRNMLEKSMTARINLTYDLADDLWDVYLDSGDFEDAILNICINAMHALEANGKISIQTSNIHLINVKSAELKLLHGDYVVLHITDNGCGMGNATKEKIFNPFFSTKGEKGTGLGLS